MGWKNVKEYYRIEHIVRVNESGICIGSSYIHNIMVIGLDGALKKRYEDRGSNVDLARYQREMDDDPIKLRELVQAPDTFGPSTTVYTYDGGEILEKLCETPGWPNVTHEGAIMYENTFSTDKAFIVDAAKRNAVATIRCMHERIAEFKAELRKREETLAEAQMHLEKLSANFPESAPTPSGKT